MRRERERARAVLRGCRIVSVFVPRPAPPASLPPSLPPREGHGGEDALALALRYNSWCSERAQRDHCEAAAAAAAYVRRESRLTLQRGRGHLSQGASAGRGHCGTREGGRQGGRPTTRRATFFCCSKRRHFYDNRKQLIFFCFVRPSRHSVARGGLFVAPDHSQRHFLRRTEIKSGAHRIASRM